jgi:uncharacterized membrane protein
LNRPVSIRTRLATSLGTGLVCSSSGLSVGPAEGALIGLAVAGVIFVVFGWRELWPLTWWETRHFAASQDPSRSADEAIVVGIAFASLGGIAAFLITGRSSSDPWAAAVAVVAVAMAWASLHLMYAGRYAKIYYQPDRAQDRPIDFNSDDPPSYRDFLYFSYNLGMTYQVSDTAVRSADIRKVVLFHCLLSYVFGTAILATTINLVLGALTG